MTRSTALSCFLVFLAATVPFVGTVGHAFLNWDDPEYVTDNPLLTGPSGLARIWTGFDNPQVYPLVFTTFWIEYRLWGAHPAGYHLVNLLLHGLASVLLFRFLRRLPLPPYVAAAAAALFAVHPTQAASVAWISERKNVLSGVFYFSCLGSYLSAMEGGRGRDLIRSLVFALLATLSKTTAVTIPLTLVLLEGFVGGAGAPAGASRAVDQVRPARLRGAILRLLPFGGIALFMAALTIFREHGPTVTSDVGLTDRILVAGRAFWFYAGKLLLPVPLAGVYHRWSVASCRLPGLLGWVAIVALALLAFRVRRRIPGAVPFGLVQFFVAGLPTSGIIPFGYMDKSFVADHFLYLPAWGFWVCVFSGVAWIETLIRGGRPAVDDKRSAAGWRRSAVVWAAIALCLLFAPLSAAHARVWKDTPTFWNHVLSRDPESWLAFGNRGQWHAVRGELAPALSDLTQAVRLHPEYVEANFNLAWVLDSLGRPQDAERAYLRTIQISPQHPDAHNNLGVLYLRTGRFDLARRELETAVSLEPGNVGFVKNLRRLEAVEGRAR